MGEDERVGPCAEAVAVGHRKAEGARARGESGEVIVEREDLRRLDAHRLEEAIGAQDFRVDEPGRGGVAGHELAVDEHDRKVVAHARSFSDDAEKRDGSVTSG